MSVSASSASVSQNPHYPSPALAPGAPAAVGLTTPRSESGAQPITSTDENIILAVNGEIYNHRLIRKHLKNTYHFKTGSDCEVVIPLVSPLPQVPHGRP
jgi:glutamine amidotransferase-like protein